MKNKFLAKEILDSKGAPTIEVELKNDFGIFKASVPSGVSTGKYEAVAVEVKKALENIKSIIASVFENEDLTNQKRVDEILIKLDGAKNKSRLGANAILVISIACCRAAAAARQMPLYRHISQLAENSSRLSLPQLSVLMAEGGKHGKGSTDIQEFMIACPFDIAKEIHQKFKKNKFKTGLEGGFIVPVKNPEEVLDLILKVAGDNKIKFILDIAAAHLQKLKTAKYYMGLVEKYPILGIEDPFPEDDYESWAALNSKFQITNSNTIIIGDDLTTTNPERIKMAKEKKLCNAVIIKPNQIGTITETIKAAKLAKSYGWKTIVSHRSGETMDDFIADLAVGIGADFIKSGAPFPKERMAKYNRLAKIEQELKSV